MSVDQERLGPPRRDVVAGGPLEAERALLGTADAYLTPSLDAPVVGWTHTQAETGGGTGLALHVDAAGRRWDTFSVLAGKARLRVDRIYLTTGGERPPADAGWPADET